MEQQLPKYLTPLRVFFALGAVILFLYAPCITLPPAGDDWMLIHPAQELVRTHGIGGALVGIFSVPVCSFYRPLALLPSVFVEQDFVLFQALKLVFQLVFAWLIYRTARGIGLKEGWSLLVATLIPLHQVFASVMTEIDLWGDLIPSLVFIVLIDSCRRLAESEVSARKFHIIAIVLSVICLLSKEAGVACFMIPLLFAIIRPVSLSTEVRKQLWLSAGLMLLLNVGYMVVRSVLSIPSTSDDHYYDFAFGTNILKNCALAVAALLSPVNTIFVALESPIWKLLAGLFILFFIILFLIGFVEATKSRRWRWPLFLLLIVGLVQGPVFLMPHLTEANFARSLAPGWLALSICLAVMFDKYHFRTLKNSFAIVLVLWFAFDVSAVYVKCREIVIDQLRFARFRTELKAHLDGTATDSLLIAVIDPGTKGYSVYRQPFMQDLQLGEIQLGIPAAFYPQPMQSDVIVVSGTEDARAKGADCLAHEDGHVEMLLMAH